MHRVRWGWSVDLSGCGSCCVLERHVRRSILRATGSGTRLSGVHTAEKAPIGGFDLIFIGTPPDSHLPLARAAIAERPRAILVEKPLCGPDLVGGAGIG